MAPDLRRSFRAAPDIIGIEVSWRTLFYGTYVPGAINIASIITIVILSIVAYISGALAIYIFRSGVLNRRKKAQTQKHDYQS